MFFALLLLSPYSARRSSLTTCSSKPPFRILKDEGTRFKYHTRQKKCSHRQKYIWTERDVTPCERHTVRYECTAFSKHATVNWHHSLSNVLLADATSLLFSLPEGPPERRKSVSGLLHQLVRSVSALPSHFSMCDWGKQRSL